MLSINSSHCNLHWLVYLAVNFFFLYKALTMHQTLIYIPLFSLPYLLVIMMMHCVQHYISKVIFLLPLSFFSEDIDTSFRRLLIAIPTDSHLLLTSIFSSLNVALAKSITSPLITALKKLMDYHSEMLLNTLLKYYQ